MAGHSQTPLPTHFRNAEEALHDAAVRISGGLTDFGPDTYRAGLGVLLEAMDEEARILPERRSYAFGELALTLAARLHTQAGWTQRPEVLGARIQAPLVIAGLPRSCTTVLQRLLAVDPQFQYLDSWLTLAPQPRPGGDPRQTEPYRQAVARLEDWFAQMPHWRSAHDMAADDPEECVEILRQDFVTNRFGCNFSVPTYDAWWQGQSEAGSYQRWADILRLVGADAPQRRWLLKNPGHIYGMEYLLEQFPDACVVYTHRDPLQAMPSVASVVHMAQQIGAGADADPLRVGPRELGVWSRGTAVMRAARAQRPGQFYDVHHQDYVRDPLAVVRGIYAHFGLTLNTETEIAMGEWITARPRGLHGEHRYTPAAYGLDEEMIRGAFVDYIEQYGPFETEVL